MPNSPSSTDAGALEMLSQQTIQLAAHYQRNAEDAGIVRQFLAARWKLAEALERLPDAELERFYRASFGKVYQAVLVYAQRANVIPLYFNEQKVKDVYSMRADLIEQALRMMGHAIEHTPSPRAQAERPIRIGIMAAAFQPSAETGASLPIYEHLG